jgi:hypothetical protein
MNTNYQTFSRIDNGEIMANSFYTHCSSTMSVEESTSILPPDSSNPYKVTRASKTIAIQAIKYRDSEASTKGVKSKNKRQSRV